MKQIKLILTLAILAGFNFANGQEINDEINVSSIRKNKISVNILHNLIYNINNIEFERSFENGKSSIGFYIGKTGTLSPNVNGYTSYVSEQNISYNRYLKGFDKSSFWFGGTLALATGSIVESNYSYEYNNPKERNAAYNISTVSINAKCGYQFIIKSFYLNPFVNLGYGITDNFFGKVEYSGDLSPNSLIFGYGLKTGIVF